jgi:hypothetical protein
MRAYGILKAHLRGEAPRYAADKPRYTDLRGRQKPFPKEKKVAPPLTIKDSVYMGLCPIPRSCRMNWGGLTRGHRVRGTVMRT